MEGFAEGEKRRLDRAFWQAWHAGIFAQMGEKGLKQAFKERFADETTTATNNHAQAIAFFHRLKAQGVPVSITRH